MPTAASAVASKLELIFPYQRMRLSYDEVSALATGFSHSIFADWTKLNAILKRFEGVIQKRWVKKGLKQKREILLKAFLAMPADHRPDFASFRNIRKIHAPRLSTCCSAAFLRPYINLEDLQQHHILPLFLNSRGRNLPVMFVDSDLRSAHLGRGWDFPEYAKESPTETSKSMTFHYCSPQSYGMLVFDMEEGQYRRRGGLDDRILHASRGKSDKSVRCYHPVQGLLALEIQQGIYSFLLACTKLILHDIEPNEFFLAPCAEMPAPLQPPTQNLPSLTAHQLEIPYCVPQKLDLDRIRTLVASRRASAEDHLWMLKEDPGYFVRSYEDWSLHDLDMLTHRCANCAQRVVANMLANAIEAFVSWDYIYRQFAVLTTPEKDLYTWVRLLRFLDGVQSATIKWLQALAFSPRMRHCFIIPPFDASKGTGIHVKDRRLLKEHERQVTLLFSALHCEEKRKLHGINSIVQEIQYMLDKNTEASQLIDSWIVGHFSDLALVIELKFCIEGLQPWHAIWRSTPLKTALEAEPLSQLLLFLPDYVIFYVYDVCKKTQGLIGDPSDGRFDYPVSKTYMKNNVDQMRRAEGLLDKFWEDLEMDVLSKRGLSMWHVMDARLLEPRKVYRAKAWEPPLTTQVKTQVLAEISSNVTRSFNARELSTKAIVVAPKAKTKTRGVAAVVNDEFEGAIASSAASNQASIKTINVPKRTYKVLCALFPGSSAENHQRVEIAWSDFLHAMNGIGLQPEKLYGSVWIFRPKKDALVEANRSVQFHEPKEVRRGGKIPASMVRVYGRRMKDTYGWESDMFESK